MNTDAQPIATENHTVSQSELLKRMGISRPTMAKYKRLGYLQDGRHRPGVAGFWYTPAKANRCIRLTGNSAEPF